MPDSIDPNTVRNLLAIATSTSRMNDVTVNAGDLQDLVEEYQYLLREWEAQNPPAGRWLESHLESIRREETRGDRGLADNIRT